MAGEAGDERGVLYPASLPHFERHAPPPSLAETVQWFWLARWDLAPNQVRRQQLLTFPTLNLVVQPGSVLLSGPSTGTSHRDLEGTGWVLAALLQPAAAEQLGVNPAALAGRELPFPQPALQGRVEALMAHAVPASDAFEAIEVLARWLAKLPKPSDTGLLANRMLRLVATNRSMTQVSDLADALDVGVRSLQRLSAAHLGVPPLQVIRRYRVQEAAMRLRGEPGLSLARLAAELSYTDQAHFATDFRRFIGLTPGSYQRQAAASSSEFT